MTCPALDVSERLISFSVRYQLNGTMSGTVTVAAPSCDDEATTYLGCAGEGFCTPIQASLGAVTDQLCGDCPTDYADDPCFSEDPNWISGLILGAGVHGVMDEVPTLTFRVGPFSTYLENKPIHTQLYRKVGVSTVLSDIATIYAGIPSGVRDFNPINNEVTGPVTGNSVMQELKLLAAAGYSHMFTQVGGDLTIDRWKTNNSTVDYIIPQSLIYSTKKIAVTPARVSLIQARGAGVSRYECGKQIFNDSRIDATAKGGYSSIGGTTTSKAISGMKTPSMDLSMSNLAANRADIRNAEWEAETAEPGSLVASDDGSLKTEITRIDGEWFDDQGTEFRIQVSGKRRPDYEARGVSEQVRPAQQEQQALVGKDHDRWAVVSPYPIPQGSFFSESLPFGSINPSYDASSESLENIQTLIADARMSSCGVRMEQINNKYSHVKEDLFLQGVRRFQEMRMKENTYVIEMGYMPCLRLNQVIQFQFGQAEGCIKDTVTGIVAGLDVHFRVLDDGSPDARMTLTVWDTSCIGTNVYTSANLMINRCAGSESSSDNPWTTSAFGLDSHAAADNNCGFLYIEGYPNLAYFQLTHDNFSLGDTYTLSFDYEQLTGSEPFSVAWPGGSTGLSGTGSFSIPFVPVTATGTFQWACANTSLPVGYKVCNMQITKTVVA